MFSYTFNLYFITCVSTKSYEPANLYNWIPIYWYQLHKDNDSLCSRTSSFSVRDRRNLFPGSLIQWYSCDLAIHILCSPYNKKKSNRENKEKWTFLPTIPLISATPMLCHEMVKTINYLGFMFHSCIRGIIFCLYTIFCIWMLTILNHLQH